MPICVPAVLTRHLLSHPVIYPSAPRPGVERLLRQRVMRRPQQAVRRNASSHKPPPPLFSTRLEHPNSGMQNVLLWHVVLRACCSHTSPPQRPTAPPQRSSPRCREASSSARHVMRRPIMQTAVRHKASSRTPPSPLFPTSLDHPESGMQNVLLWHDVLCACVFHTSPPQRPTAPPKRSSTRGRNASSSARHAATHHVDGCQT